VFPANEEAYQQKTIIQTSKHRATTAKNPIVQTNTALFEKPFQNLHFESPSPNLNILQQ
jgi:hypothetical protein